MHKAEFFLDKCRAAFLKRFHPNKQNCAQCGDRIATVGERMRGLPEPSIDVDVVITWADGSDPAFRAQCKQYHTQLFPGKKLETGRFRDNGELRYALRAIEQFAPWVRTIHLLTNNQRPSWLDMGHPKLHLVDHRECIPETYLPTFNSHVIEAFLHKIPGLAEQYIYVNDDVFLGRPVKKSDFFTSNGMPYCFIDWRPLRKFGYGWRRTPHSASYYNTLRLLQECGIFSRKDKGFICAHGPYAQTIRNAEDAFRFYEGAILDFCGNRFRTTQEMAFYCHAAPMWLFEKKRIIPCDERYFYVQNRQVDRGVYYRILLESQEQAAPPMFFCINDTGSAPLKSSWDRDLRDILSKYFPEPGSMEKTG